MSVSWETMPKLAAQCTQGASADEVEKTEAAIGEALPDDIRALLARQNGRLGWDVEAPPGTKANQDYVLKKNHWRLLATYEIVSEVKTQRDLMRGGDFDGLEDGTPTGPMSGAFWNEAWIPFATTGGGDFLCWDGAPEAGGTKGQVIVAWRDNTKDRTVLATSVGAWLGHVDATL